MERLAAEQGQNPLLPAPADLFWGLVCFLILVALFARFVLPQMQKALRERTNGIERKLEQAERDRAEAEALLADYRQQLAEARGDAARIRTEAQSERKAIVDEARSEAQAAAQQVADRTHAQLQADVAQARGQLSREVGRIAVDLASRVIGENLADTERTRATVDRFITELDEAAADGLADQAAGQGAGGATAIDVAAP